jgi:K+-transporting ATPase ATPase C chain
MTAALRTYVAPAGILLLVFVVLTGIAYPLLVTGLAQAIFPNKADGSLIEVDGTAIGSRLLGQPFEGPQYFHGRPSAVDYDTCAVDDTECSFLGSAASNYGPTNPDYLALVAERAAALRELEGLPADYPLPVDAVTASGSGLDPHISVAYAELQVPRVARERGLSEEQVFELVDERTEGRTLGILGEKRVNVLELNLALDELD